MSLLRSATEEARNIAASAKKVRQQSAFNASIAQRKAESFTSTELGDAVTFVPPPTSATDPGVSGQIATDADWLYVCIGSSEWRRVAISTW